MRSNEGDNLTPLVSWNFIEHFFFLTNRIGGGGAASTRGRAPTKEKHLHTQNGRQGRGWKSAGSLHFLDFLAPASPAPPSPLLRLAPPAFLSAPAFFFSAAAAK